VLEDGRASTGSLQGVSRTARAGGFGPNSASRTPTLIGPRLGYGGHFTYGPDSGRSLPISFDFQFRIPKVQGEQYPHSLPARLFINRDEKIPTDYQSRNNATSTPVSLGTNLRAPSKLAYAYTNHQLQEQPEGPSLRFPVNEARRRIPRDTAGLENYDGNYEIATSGVGGNIQFVAALSIAADPFKRAMWNTCWGRVPGK